MTGLEDRKGEAGFDQVFFYVALAVVIHQFAEDGMQHAAVDEVLDFGADGGVDHVIAYFFFARVHCRTDVVDCGDVFFNSMAFSWLGDVGLDDFDA